MLLDIDGSGTCVEGNELNADDIKEMLLDSGNEVICVVWTADDDTGVPTCVATECSGSTEVETDNKVDNADDDVDTDGNGTDTEGHEVGSEDSTFGVEALG